MQPFISAEPQDQLLRIRISGEAMRMLDGLDQTWRREHFEPLVDTDEELRRNNRALNGAELNAFDLPCKWPSNGYIQGALVAFIPKNG